MIPFNAQRVYLSGPMTGIAQDNRPAFRAASRLLRGAGYEVVSPDELDTTAPAAGHTWAEFLTRDIPFVVSCGLAVLLPGWEKSKGSRLEIAIMAALGRPVYLLEGDLNNHVDKLFEIGDLKLVQVAPEKLPRVTIPGEQ